MVSLVIILVFMCFFTVVIFLFLLAIWFRLVELAKSIKPVLEPLVYWMDGCSIAFFDWVEEVAKILRKVAKKK